MNKSNDFCHVTRKLVDDLPGVHWYVQACKDCHKEYGPEFAIAHWSSGLESDPVPDVVLAPCRSRVAHSHLPSHATALTLCAA